MKMWESGEERNRRGLRGGGAVVGVGVVLCCVVCAVCGGGENIHRQQHTQHITCKALSLWGRQLYDSLAPF